MLGDIMDKLLAAISEKLPDANGGFRRRLTAGTIVGLILLVCLYPSTQSDPLSFKMLEDVLTKLTDYPFIAVLLSILVFAIGRLVEIYSELTFKGPFGLLLEKKEHTDAEGPKGIIAKIKELGFKGFCKEYLYIDLNNRLLSALFSTLAAVIGAIFLLITLLAKQLLKLCMSPILFFIWSLTLMEQYRSDVKGILPLSALTQKQRVALKMKELSALPTNNPSAKMIGLEELQEIIKRPFSREFETLWLFIKNNLQEFEAGEVKRRERNFTESLTISSSVVIAIILLMLFLDPLEISEPLNNVFVVGFDWTGFNASSFEGWISGIGIYFDQKILPFARLILSLVVYAYVVIFVFLSIFIMNFLIQRDLIVFTLRLAAANSVAAPRTRQTSSKRSQAQEK